MERILLIDDDKNVRDSLTLTLESAGYSVTNVSNTQEGLYHYQEAPASVVITDVITLEHCGLESIRELRQQAPSIPIIALSGTFQPNDEDEGEFDRTLDPVCTLQKPFTVDELLSTVKTVLPHSYA